MVLQWSMFRSILIFPGVTVSYSVQAMATSSHAGDEHIYHYKAVDPKNLLRMNGDMIKTCQNMINIC